MKKTTIFISILSLTLLLSSIGASLIYKKATNVSANTSSKLTLATYLESESNNHSTSLPDPIESKLNEQGIFDNEINDLDTTILNDLENNSDYSISVKYYSITPSNKSQSSITEMSDSEIDSLINYCFSNTEYTTVSEWLTSLEKINLLPHTAYAEEHSSGPITTSGGKFKNIVICTTKKNSKKFNISYTGEWLVSPKNRKTDVIYIHTDNHAYILKENVKATYTTVDTYGPCMDGSNFIIIPSQKKTKTISYDLVNMNESRNWNHEGTKIAFKCNLRDSYYDNTSNGNVRHFFDKHKFKITATGQVNDASYKKDHVTTYCSYYHQESSVELNPSLSLDGNGISFSLTPSQTSKMKELAPISVQFLTGIK